MAKSLKRSNASKTTKKPKPAPPTERPEDNIDESEIAIRDPNYELKHNAQLKVDDKIDFSSSEYTAQLFS